MTDRERLIELIKIPHKAAILREIQSVELDEDEILADYLLSNGVIVPPCKVDDTVYVICNKMVQETTVFSMKVETEDKNYVFYIKALAVDGMNKTVHGYATVFKIFVFGKTAFLTREEAEKALEERQGKQ